MAPIWSCLRLLIPSCLIAFLEFLLVAQSFLVVAEHLLLTAQLLLVVAQLLLLVSRQFLCLLLTISLHCLLLMGNPLACACY